MDALNRHFIKLCQKNSSIQELRDLIETGGVSQKSLDTGLVATARKSKNDLAIFLIENGADVLTDYGTIFNCVIRYDNVELFAFITEHRDYQLSLDDALYFGALRIVKYLILEKPAAWKSVKKVREFQEFKTKEELLKYLDLLSI